MAARKPKIDPVFHVTRNYLSRFVKADDEQLDLLAVWAIGTWTFSPSATNPATYPYLYIAAPKGAGKTTLGQDVLGGITRMHQSTVGITGPSLFRMMGEFDEETGRVITTAPTLAIDEIDATFSGAKDEGLRQMLNAGYRRGATVPRVMGRETILYPVYSPKILMGIDNGHLPDTVLDRSIRIDLERATPDEMAELEPFYIFEVEDEAAEISSTMAEWAKDHSAVLTDYKPRPIDGLGSPRRWEISRSLVQLARELGIEDRVRLALLNVMTRTPERPSHKVELYGSIMELFDSMPVDRVTTRQILDKLAENGLSVPGGSGKGLAAALSEEGIAPTYIKLRPDHPGYDPNKSSTQRGYFRHMFDGAFVRYLDEDE